MSDLFAKPLYKLFTKSTILFCAGLAGVTYETIVVKQPDADLLVLFGGMMGMPAFFGNQGYNKDEHEHEHEEKSGT